MAFSIFVKSACANAKAFKNGPMLAIQLYPTPGGGGDGGGDTFGHASYDSLSLRHFPAYVSKSSPNVVK